MFQAENSLVHTHRYPDSNPRSQFMTQLLYASTTTYLTLALRADTNKKGNSSLPCLQFVIVEQTHHVNKFHIPYVVLIC